MRGRIVKKLDSPWRFCPDANRVGEAEQWHIKGLAHARSVSVPHTWNVEDELEDYRGLAWYEYRFRAPEEWKGSLIRIKFEAVYRDAVVWLNGFKVGEHRRSGYTTFILDLTSAVRFDRENLLTVLVDNSNSEESLPIRNSFDWADDGGIIRDVSLIITGPTAIDYLMIDAMPVFPARANDPIAGMISAKAALCGQPVTKPDQCKVDLAVLKEGSVVWKESRIPVLSDGSAAFGNIRLDSVDLWHFDHPHLYTFSVDLYVNGELSDRIESTFGFREITTKGHQLFLNREPVRLFGVEWMPGSHPAVGMAESEADLYTWLKRMKDVNCVFTRFHWQQHEKLLDWCDRNGILVQEDIPH